MGRRCMDGTGSLDGKPVKRINSLLEPAGVTQGMPLRLTAYRELSFSGSKLDARGFLISQTRQTSFCPRRKMLMSSSAS